MATKKKAPKRPKASASISAWEKYHEKFAAVEKHNADVEKDKDYKRSLMDARPGTKKKSKAKSRSRR